MKKFVLTQLAIVLLIGLYHPCTGQKIVIGARHELHVSAGYTLPIGPSSIDKEPTLLANMKPGQLVEVRYMALVYKSIYVGGWASMSEFNEWSTPDSQLYLGSSMTFLSFGPTIMYKPWSPGNNVSNKLNFCASLSPGISQLAVNTSSSSEINTGSETNPLEVEALRFTLGANAGLHYVISNSFGVTLLAGYQLTVSDSKIFPDKSYSYASLRAGVFYRLFKDRKYKYSGL